MKDHRKAKIVNEITLIAEKYANTQQLRARLRGYLLPIINEVEQDTLHLSEDKKRIDWLSDPKQMIGNISLPTQCVENNMCSLRDAIDAAMAL